MAREMKKITPSPELAKVLGSAEPLARTEVVTKLWQYIRAHNLQDTTNKRNINCDEAFQAVMGKPTVTMFEMSKLVSAHLT